MSYIAVRGHLTLMTPDTPQQWKCSYEESVKKAKYNPGELKRKTLRTKLQLLDCPVCSTGTVWYSTVLYKILDTNLSWTDAQP